jgi:DNA-binding MarR family transcriptional regulator
MVADQKKTGKAKLDRLIHEPARLQIVSYLAAAEEPEVSFSELSEKLGLTAGNLSVQLKRLEEAGYLSITKAFKENRPLTTVMITRNGIAALKLYLKELEELISQLKSAMPENKDEKR